MLFVALIEVIEITVIEDGNKESTTTEIYPIEADCEDSARGVIRQHFEDKCEPYAVRYVANIMSMNSLIK